MTDQLALSFYELGTVFTPSASIDNSALFAGRKPQILKVIDAVGQRGQHAVIYGERGVGKTSLANVLHDFLVKQNLRAIEVVKVNCEQSTNFSSLWHSVFRRLFIQRAITPAGFNGESTNESMPASALLPVNVTPDDVRFVFEQVNRHTIVIIDEVDRIQDLETTTRLADTVKTLSDTAVNATLVLVGVGDSVDDLIGEHPSIERALVQIQMPRMSRDELFEILNKGLPQINMTMDEDAKVEIARLSEGLPHYTHLLGLHSAQIALIHDRKNITKGDVKDALSIALEQAQQSIVRSYHKATDSPRGNLYTQVLLACALAPVDELGYFLSSAVRTPMSLIMHKPYDIPAFSRHLKDFCEQERGPVLEKEGYPRRYKFRFKNPLMEPYVIMHGLSKKLITEDELERLQGGN